MNNYWHTNYKAGQGGHHAFRFSLTSSPGAFSTREAVTRGWEMFCPPVAQQGQGQQKPILSAAAKDLVTVKPKGLPLMAFKQAEDQRGFVFRVCDFSGEAGTLKLALPKPAIEVMSCDLVEANARPHQGRGKTVTAPLKPFGPATLKVIFSPGVFNEQPAKSPSQP